MIKEDLRWSALNAKGEILSKNVNLLSICMRWKPKSCPPVILHILDQLHL